MINGYACCNELYDSPLFVCDKCAKIIRVFAYEETEKYYCSYCNTLMIKTKFGLPDFQQYMLMSDDIDSVKLRNWIYVEYVRNSMHFDRECMNRRISEEKEEFENRILGKGAFL